MMIRSLLLLLLLILIKPGEVGAQTLPNTPSSDTVKIHAVVHVTYVVNKDGSLDKMKAKIIECSNCDSKLKKELKMEAEKIIQKRPQPPLSEKGVPAKTQYTQPVVFDITDK